VVTVCELGGDLKVPVDQVEDDAVVFYGHGCSFGGIEAEVRGEMDSAGSVLRREGRARRRMDRCQNEKGKGRAEIYGTIVGCVLLICLSHLVAS
jgi:hypothetical protein